MIIICYRPSSVTEAEAEKAYQAIRSSKPVCLVKMSPNADPYRDIAFHQMDSRPSLWTRIKAVFA